MTSQVLNFETKTKSLAKLCVTTFVAAYLQVMSYNSLQWFSQAHYFLIGGRCGRIENKAISAFNEVEAELCNIKLAYHAQCSEFSHLNTDKFQSASFVW